MHTAHRFNRLFTIATDDYSHGAPHTPSLLVCADGRPALVLAPSPDGWSTAPSPDGDAHCRAIARAERTADILRAFRIARRVANSRN